MDITSPIPRLTVEHFKPFADAQEIPLRPITLIYGPNSSGKSSILQAILLLVHALQKDSIHDACVGAAPGAPDLGGVEHFSYRNDLSKPVKLSVRLEPGVWSGLKPAPQSETGFVDLDSVGEAPPESLVRGTDVFDCTLQIREGFSFHLNGRLLIAFGGHVTGAVTDEGRRSLFPDSRSLPNRDQPFTRDESSMSLFGDESDFDHEVLRLWVAARFERKTGQILDDGLWSAACKAAASGFQTRAWMYGILPFMVSSDNYFDFSGAHADESRGDAASARERLIFSLFEEFVFRLIQAVRLRLNDLLSGSIYLGPLRSYTGRKPLNPNSATDSSHPGGDFASAALISSPGVVDRVNDWLERRLGMHTPYRLVIRRFFESEKGRRDFRRELKEIEEGGGFPGPGYLASVYDSTGALIEISIKDVRSGILLSQRDVGVGISQVLPILVAAVGTWKRWHLIEQPELHLHPAQQAEMADLFIESALGDNGNQFVIETHSEHLLLRIMKRIREAAADNTDGTVRHITHEHVSVLYVEPTANGSTVRQMKLNARGELVSDWPGGFFEEGLRELLI